MTVACFNREPKPGEQGSAATGARIGEGIAVAPRSAVSPEHPGVRGGTLSQSVTHDASRRMLL